jgi:hypothetical protein
MMEFLSYAGWTIKTKETNKGIGAVMADPGATPSISQQLAGKAILQPCSMPRSLSIGTSNLQHKSRSLSISAHRAEHSSQANLLSFPPLKYTCFLEIQMMNGQTLLRQLRFRKIYCAHPQSMLSAVHRNLSRNLRHLVTDK